MDSSCADDKKKFTFTWKIKDFSCLWMENEILLQSPTFKITDLGEHDWNIILYDEPTELERFDPLEIYVSLHSHQVDDPDIKMNIRMCYVDRHETSHFVTNYKEAVVSKESEYYLCHFDIKPILENTELFLPQDSLTIRIEMCFEAKDDLKNNACLAITSISKERRCFTWDIENLISSRPGKILSLRQSLSLLSGFIMHVHLSEERIVEIEFVLEGDVSKCRAVCHLCLLNSSKAVIKSKTHTFNLFFAAYNRYQVCNATVSLINVVNEGGFILDDEIKHLKCEFNVAGSHRHDETIQYACKPSEHLKNSSSNDGLEVLMEDLSVLYIDKSNCDAVLRVRGKDIDVHKAILSARSPVFKAIFDKEVVGKGISSVNITEFDVDTINRMLKFMYTSTVDDFDVDGGLKLFEASKYEIQFLKDKCAAHLMCDLSVNNICKILVAAHRHQDEELSKICRSFMCGIVEEIFSSDEWMWYLNNETDLADKIMKKIE